MGIPGRHATAAELRDMEPALSDRFKRGLLLPGNSFTVNPARLVETLFDLFMSAGGAFERTTLRHIERDGSRVVAVSTDRGVYRPGSLVICTGAWSAPFARSLGVRVPLVAERGYHVTFSGNPARINYKVMNASRGFGATQMQDGLQISGTVELADVDAPPDWSRARALARNARLMFREELGEPDGRWMGCRPSLPDSLPVVERVPSLANAYLNFGHSHWGLSGAPRSAEMIADLIAGLPAGPAAGTFASGRFRWGARPTDIDDPKCSRRT
jgi:D-amino-acid dehydrogenase